MSLAQLVTFSVTNKHVCWLKISVEWFFLKKT